MTKIKADFTEVARKMMAGVVQIHIEGNLDADNQSVMNPAIRIPGNWSGSGFFIKYGDLEGYIVTNAHVARNAVKIKISSMLTSEERFEADVVGLVKQLEPDVALLKLTDGELERFNSMAFSEIEYLELREGSSLSRGEEIKAIGYPMGMVEPNIYQVSVMTAR
jgi:S1-C subfamily serine protease